MNVLQITFIQVALSQWALVIQLLEFHNPLNIVTEETEMNENSDIEYCCCDKNSVCASQSSFYNMNHNCDNKCDIFFVVSVSNCDDNSAPCSISTIEGTIKDSPPDSLYGYTFFFNLVDLVNLVSYFSQKICNLCVFKNICTCVLSYQCIAHR